MQDPWHSEYYWDKPKHERPPKYWFSYYLNKWLEPIAMKGVSGLVSVSQAYIDDLKDRYTAIRNISAEVVTFGAFQKDFEIATNNTDTLNGVIKSKKGEISIAYVGRGGADMRKAVKLLFDAFKTGLELNPEAFKRFHFYFIGTSYAAAGSGNMSIKPLAEAMGIGEYVSESTDRIGFYESIATLQNADILFIPGSDDSRYTASKIFPYILSNKPLLAIFHKDSSAVDILRTCSPDAKVYTFSNNTETRLEEIHKNLDYWTAKHEAPLVINEQAFSDYSASAMAAKQVALFEHVLALDQLGLVANKKDGN